MSPAATTRRLVRAAAALAAALATGCGAARQPGPDAAGVVAIEAGLRRDALAPAGVGEVRLRVEGTTASGEAWSRSVAGLPAGTGWTAFVDAPVGSYRVSGEAWATAAGRAVGAAPDLVSAVPLPVTVLARETTTVALALGPDAASVPPAAGGNAAPSVEGVVASVYRPDAGAPAAVLLAARASDGDGDPLRYAWTASYAPAPGGGAGGFTAPAALETSFATPAGYEGEIALTFAAEDPARARSSLTVQLEVTRDRDGRKGGVEVRVGVNRWPDVGPIAVGAAQPAPGATTTFSVAATDADRDALAFAWDDGGCGGTFASPAAAATAWRAPDAERACVVRARVTDGRGGASASSVTVDVRRRASAAAPEFAFAAQSPANPVAPGAPVAFEAVAAQPDGAGGYLPLALPLAWSDGAGGTFTPLDPGGERVSWVAPGCGGAQADVVLEVTATAFGGAWPSQPADRTAFAFPVVVRCP